MTREGLQRAEAQKRLLLCLFGLGTNTGLKRVSAGDPSISYSDLRYVRKRFITREGLRAANAHVVNAILAARQSDIWGKERLVVPAMPRNSPLGTAISRPNGQSVTVDAA